MSIALVLLVTLVCLSGIGRAANYSLLVRNNVIVTGQGLVVDWASPTGSSANDWIALFKTGAPNSAYDPARWRYTGGATSGFLWFSAPEPGTYEFRYLPNSGFTAVAVSQGIVVTGSTSTVNTTTSTNNTTTNTGSTYSLVASPTSVLVGQNVTVNWQAPAGSSRKDWISLYRSGDANTNYDGNRWQYTSGATAGSYTVLAPSTPGTYEFRYLVNDGFTSTTASQLITVTAPTATVTTTVTAPTNTSTYALVTGQTTVQPGQSVTVDWTAPSGSSSKDWIGWFKTTDVNTAWDGNRWKYTGGGASGSFTIAAPTLAGTYEFRYLLNDGFTSTARSQTVTVAGTGAVTTNNVVTTNTTTTNSTTYSLQATPTVVQENKNVTVKWSVPSGRGAKDWIGWFKVGAPNNAFDTARWVYTNGASSGTFTTTSPNVAGVYEFRYLFNDGFSSATASNSVSVSVAATGPAITLSASPDTIPVGQSTLLSWVTANVTTCTASGAWSGTKVVAGSQSIFPNATGTYTLTCNGSLGTTSQSVVVNVVAASTANLYYVATNGNDNNPGTLTAPFRTLPKAVSVLRPGDTLLVRGGEYDTVNGLTTSTGGISIIPSGLSWNQPVTIKAYPGENVVFRRYMPAGSPSDDIVARSIHLATAQECETWARNRWGANWQTYYKSYPYDCWSGSGSANDGLYYQAPLGFAGGAIISMFNDEANPVQYIVFDGIDFDARGITQNVAQFYSGAKHIRFINSKMRNAIGSCVTQPGLPDSSILTDLQFIRVTIHSCGVPYDTNTINGVLARKSPIARFFHPWYMHAGGNLLEDSEVYDSAGTGLGPDGNYNVIRGNYIHDNSGQGLFITGGDGWIVEYNVFRNNGGPGIYHQNGGNHVIRHNTVVQDYLTITPTSYGVLMADLSWGTTYENNIIVGYNNPVWNNSIVQTPNTLRNNLIQSTLLNREITNATGSVPLVVQSNILGQDPRFLSTSDFRLQSGSPAAGTATDGGNIGAR